VLRLGYICHDVLPSHGTHTQQIVWTVHEVTRLGVRVELTVPGVELASDALPARDVLAAYYGLPPGRLAPGFVVDAVWRVPLARWIPRPWYERHVAARIRGRGANLVWTRDLTAAAACVRAGLPTLFETYRLDLATHARFALARRAVLGSPHLRGVVAHSRLAAEAFIGAGLAPSRCLVAHNGFAPVLMEPRLAAREARRRLGLPLDGSIVVYAGHTGRRKGIDAIIRMAAAVPEARFVIVGVDPGRREARRLERLASSLKAGNVQLRARVKTADVAPYLYAADCLLIPPTGEPLRRFKRTVLPMKIFSYLAAGRPILAPSLPDVAEVLTDGETALLVSPSRIADGAAALRRLLADRRLQERLAANALALAGQYTWEARARRIVEFVERAQSTVEGAGRQAPFGSPA
jgi:glycosyltransferase involved in cell wall biosynthesis